MAEPLTEFQSKLLEDAQTSPIPRQAVHGEEFFWDFGSHRPPLGRIIDMATGREALGLLVCESLQPPFYFWYIPTVYLLYVDESGDPGPLGSKFLLVAGAVLFEGRWAAVKSAIDELLAKHARGKTRQPKEVHLADLWQRKDDFRGWSIPERDSLIQEYCQIASSLLPEELRFFFAVADKDEWFSDNPGKTGEDLYAILFEDICSRFDLFLRRRYAEGAPHKGMIVADPHKPDLSNALKSNHLAFQRDGTRWGAVYNLIETVFFLPSDQSPGLQLADLCAYAAWRAVNAGDPSIANMIRDVFDRESPTAAKNPGKWHGVKYLGRRAAVKSKLAAVWPP